MGRESATRSFMIAAVLLFLSACSTSSGGGGGDSSFVAVRQTTISGVNYKVWKVPGSGNSFVAEASGSRRGSPKGASAAVIKLFNCQRAKMEARGEAGQRFEGRGSFCDDFREWQPLR